MSQPVITSPLQDAIAAYNYIFDEVADQYTKQYFLMGSPIPVVLITALYYLFVTRFGMKLMRGRKPFELKYTIITFNVIQIIANLWLVTQVIPLMAQLDSRLLGCLSYENYPNYHPEGPFAVKIRSLGVFYFWLKLSDYVDTIFMVLKKNYHQITFLHVYHHLGMCIGVWFIINFFMSGHEGFTVCVNAIIHVFMYSYYLARVSFPGIKNSLWCKRFITQLQLGQFFLIFYHHVKIYFDDDCKVPKRPIIFYMTQVFMMIVLFSNFYYNTYIIKKQPKTVQSKSQ